MSAPEVQACLARLYVDAAFRRLLCVDPAFVFARYELDEHERDALRALDSRKLEFFAGTLRDKRREKILAAYPRLLACAGKRLEVCFDRFHELHPPHVEQTSDEERRLFGLFVADTLAATADVESWVPDVAVFERLEHRIRVAAREAPAPPLPGPLHDETRLRQAAEAAGAVFRTPVVDVIQALDAGRTPAVEPRESFVILRGQEAFYVSAPVWHLFEQCDGRTSLAAIVRAHPQARAALEHLRDLRLVVAAC